MPIHIHHLQRSQSERILWLCEELSLPYTTTLYRRDSTTGLAPAAYKSLTPSQTSPVITDGELVLAESGACVEYIVNTYAPGSPLFIRPGQEGYADFLFWWHYAQGSLQGAIMSVLLLSESPPEARMKAFAAQRMEVAIRAVDGRLGESRFLAGKEFTVADLMCLFYFTTMNLWVKMDLGKWKNVERWVGEVSAREAYKRAMGKGDPGFEPLKGAKI